MTFTYPAIFKRTEKGTYEGYFPDLRLCKASGETLEDAVLNAHDAAFDWITLELGEEDPAMPAISEKADLHLKDGEIVRNICVNIRFTEGWDE